VSYDKGCFMGQEPLARVHARGQVNRVMVQVRSHQAPPERAVLGSAEREKAGEWTSWAPHGDAIIGLALVHRSLATPGTVLRTAAGVEVEVTSGPLGDDPGGGTRESGKEARVQLGRK
jgi:folate-binding Fe-S cluster repair protein YgfZ